ncbi:MAG: class D sortase [Acidobacteriota bacterium]|nr:class D sortase [Acidobacteriota bacterium]
MTRRTLAGVLRWLERALLVTGAFAAAWYLFVRIDATVANAEARARLRPLIAAAAERAPAVAARQPPQPIPPRGALIGEIDVPRLDLSTIVRQGATAGVLRLGAGHIPGTALPGQRGNVGVAGHRDTVFRPLRHIRRGDLITLATPSGTFHYHVAWTRIVLPTDVGVLRRTAAPSITLVTCYPFYFVGHAPRRFIVRAVAGPPGHP